MAVTTRRAVMEDKSRCLALLQELGAATDAGRPAIAGAVFEQLIDGSRAAAIVAEEHGTVLGMACVSYNLALRYDGEYCQLEELVVTPQARGKNVGGLLVQRTIDEASARGCTDYGLYLVAATEHNRAFYEKYGFAAVGTEMRQRLVRAC